MKKKVFGGVMLLVAAMIFSVSGTCFAQPSGSVFVDTTLSGTTRLAFGPVFSSADRDGRRNIGSGATAYGIIGNPFGVMDFGGATPFAIARKITDAAGDMNLVWMPDLYAPDFSGSTPTGSPAVISGATNAFVVAVQAFDDGAIQVANFNRANNANTGVTVMMIDGATMTANWTLGIPEVPVASNLLPLDFAAPYFPTELTIWKPKPGDRLDETGVTIYGTTTADPASGSGASVWSLTNWGAPAGGGTWDAGSGMTAWPVIGSAYSFTGSNTNILVAGAARTVAPIDGFVASPVISGNSVFYVGTDAASGVGGITVYQLHKDNLGAGVIYAATVKPVGAAQTWSDRFMPTPVASGGSLFVVCNQGGVTVYDTQDLDTTRTAGYVGNLLLPQGVFTGVTASPVVYQKQKAKKDPYIIMCGTSAVTAYRISDGLAGNQRQWWYDFAANIGAGSQIWGTPAVAAGYVFVPVVDAIGLDGRVYAFRIEDAPDLPNGQLNFSDVYDLNGQAVASPIVVNRELWAFSFGIAPASSAEVTKWNVNNLLNKDDVKAHSYWTQFKFDAAKTGSATKVTDDDEWYDEGSSGCFLTTIQ